VWKISRASVYRSLKETPPNTIARPGPVGACSDAELVEHIRQHIAASRLHGEGYRKLWARLRLSSFPGSCRRVTNVKEGAAPESWRSRAAPHGLLVQRLAAQENLDTVGSRAPDQCFLPRTTKHRPRPRSLGTATAIGSPISTKFVAGVTGVEASRERNEDTRFA
jgi:hypothetical protein